MTAISDAIDTVWNNMTDDLLSALIGFCIVGIVVIIAANIFFPPVDESNERRLHLISVVAIVILLIGAVVSLLLRFGYIQV